MIKLVIWHNGTLRETKDGPKSANTNHYARVNDHRTLCNVSFKKKIGKGWFRATSQHVKCGRCLGIAERWSKTQVVEIETAIDPEVEAVLAFGLIEPVKITECSSYSVWGDGQRVVTIGTGSLKPFEPIKEPHNQS